VGKGRYRKDSPSQKQGKTRNEPHLVIPPARVEVLNQRNNPSDQHPDRHDQIEQHAELGHRYRFLLDWGPVRAPPLQPDQEVDRCEGEGEADEHYPWDVHADDGQREGDNVRQEEGKSEERGQGVSVDEDGGWRGHDEGWDLDVRRSRDGVRKSLCRGKYS
jgi:hypothetical protein